MHNNNLLIISKMPFQLISIQLMRGFFFLINQVFFVRTSLLTRLLLIYKALHCLSHHTWSSLLPGCYLLIEQVFLLFLFIENISIFLLSYIFKNLLPILTTYPFTFWYGFVILSVISERAAIYAGVNLPIHDCGRPHWHRSTT